MNNAPEEETHPKPRYALVLVALVILTAAEVGISYLPEAIKLPFLIVIAIAKAALVVLWFMHLKFDKRLYALVFLIGLVLILPELLVLIVGQPLH